jgi:hypothetical protein
MISFVVVKFEPTSISETLAVEITAPLGSLTVPRTTPVVPVCATKQMEAARSSVRTTLIVLMLDLTMLASA